MQYPEEKLDSFGKRMQGIGEQPDGSSHQEILVCELNRRDNYEKLIIVRITWSQTSTRFHWKLITEIRRKWNFWDTGAEISLIKEASLNSEASYKLREGAKIKGIGNAVLKTDGIELKLFTEKHETVHNFYVLSEPSALQCDGILGKDFFRRERESVINYCSHQIIMNNEVIINFDKKPCIYNTTPCKLTLPARSECIVYVPTPSEGIGLLDRAELQPGVFLTASLTRGEGGICRTSIANMNGQGRTVTLIPVKLDIFERNWKFSEPTPLSCQY